MASLKLRVSGMTCGHCQAKVQQALLGVEGTLGASVLLEDGEAEVDFDSTRAGPERYVAAVRGVGYEAAVAE